MDDAGDHEDDEKVVERFIPLYRFGEINGEDKDGQADYASEFETKVGLDIGGLVDPGYRAVEVIRIVRIPTIQHHSRRGRDHQ